ncbi:AAA family ATPase [Streptomyces cinnamoneus]|uniref:AAA family ATPase n=1 Tax=Streptomyces cinnamoneus TaxID=53446 RepID=UPI00343A10B0
MTADQITGRAGERAELGRMLTEIRAGSGRALVLRGEPGAGKSTLLRHAAEEAAPARVLSATGVEPESGMAFAALHQLLHPVAGLVETLPDAQRQAVRTVLGLAEPTAEADRFLVSAGVLSLLAEAAAPHGLLCVVDDFQWVDQASADALLFAARRFGGHGVGLLIGTRDTGAARQALRGVPALQIGGLDAGSAGEVLAARAAVAPAPHVVELVVAATGGNPLALRETAALLSTEQLTGRAPLPDPLPAGDGVAAVYGEQVAQLPEPVRLVLLVAALEGRGDPLLIREAAERLGAGADALYAAEAAGIIDMRPAQITFRHPLLRSAVYTGATPAARRAVHGRLAALLDERDEWERGARHRAEAATGPEEGVAAGLAAVAERARARGGYADAARTWAWAAELTPDPGTRAHRFKDTAVAAWLGGHAGQARTALAAARELAREPALLAGVAQLDGRFELSSGDAAEAQRIFLAAADRAVAEPTGALRRTVLALLADAAEAASCVGDTEAAVHIGRRVEELERLHGPTEEPAEAFLHGVLAGMGAMYGGEAERGARLLRRALDGLADVGDGAAAFGGEAATLLWAAAAASLLGESDVAGDYGARAGRVARVSGMVGTLPVVLENAATAERMNSGFALSAALSEEGLALARETGIDNSVAAHLANLAVCAAVRGQEEDCRRSAHEALVIAIPHRLGLRAGVATYALGLLDLGLGRFDRAHERLASLVTAGPGTGHPVVAWGSVADRVEAAVAAGDPAAAREAAGFLEQWSARSSSARARALLARCRALVSDDDTAAAALLQEAVELLADDDGAAYDRARTALLLGERLRRDRRAGAARPYLRQAAETFHRLGAVPWEGRARGELRAAGESGGPAGPDALAALTSQELRIARLVADGASNRDVAARLFLSPRTVEYHLYKVYPKLGVTSRTELARLLQ